jgi:hypothetical protein
LRNRAEIGRAAEMAGLSEGLHIAQLLQSQVIHKF